MELIEVAVKGALAGQDGGGRGEKMGSLDETFSQGREIRRPRGYVA